MLAAIRIFSGMPRRCSLAVSEAPHRFCRPPFQTQLRKATSAWTGWATGSHCGISPPQAMLQIEQRRGCRVVATRVARSQSHLPRIWRHFPPVFTNFALVSFHHSALQVAAKQTYPSDEIGRPTQSKVALPTSIQPPGFSQL